MNATQETTKTMILFDHQCPESLPLAQRQKFVFQKLVEAGFDLHQTIQFDYEEGMNIFRQ